MTRYVGLLRAVNVGGTGKLPMAELRSMCADAGFVSIETYIASGNVVFESDNPPDAVRETLEAHLLAYAGKPVRVLLRTAEEMAAVLGANPFPSSDPRHTYVLFLDDVPGEDALEQVTGVRDEELELGSREIYISYPSGMGRSKLRLPIAAAGTSRNLRTVAKLAEMATKA